MYMQDLYYSVNVLDAKSYIKEEKSVWYFNKSIDIINWIHKTWIAIIFIQYIRVSMFIQQ